jgi:hypothetical protein
MIVAPSLDVLFDFEGQMSLACQNVFSLAQFDSGVPIGIQSSDEIKTPEYVFHFTSGGNLDGSEQFPYGFKVRDHYSGKLDVVIFTTRSENTASDAPLYRSRVRQVFILWRGRFASQDQFGNPLCPYYQILEILESGSTMTAKYDDNMDLTAVSFQIKFRINPNAWPADPGLPVLQQITE